MYLASLGWDVTGFDISETGMAVARKSAEAAGVKITTINTSMEAFDYGVEQLDLIVATYEGPPGVRKVRGLKPGGLVVVEGFLRTPTTPQGASSRSQRTREDVPRPELEDLRYEDVYGKPDWAAKPGHVIRLCAQNPSKRGRRTRLCGFLGTQCFWRRPDDVHRDKGTHSRRHVRPPIVRTTGVAGLPQTTSGLK